VPLEGPITSEDAELSGLAWHGDTLVLLPQFPARFESPRGQGAFFVVLRGRLDAWASGDPRAVVPRAVPFDGGGLADVVEGFEGFEAIAFDGDRAYLAVEASGPEGARGFLVAGTVGDETDGLVLDPASLTAIPAGSPLPNLSYESLVVDEERIIALHEVSSRRVSPTAAARAFTLGGLEPLDDLAVPSMDYRITDSTAPDGDGRIWVINYQWRGNELLRLPGSPPIAVERLVELRVAPQSLEPTGRSVDLGATGEGRNWEGIVRFGEGLLIVTDRHPGTIVAYVELP